MACSSYKGPKSWYLSNPTASSSRSQPSHGFSLLSPPFFFLPFLFSPLSSSHLFSSPFPSTFSFSSLSPILYSLSLSSCSLLPLLLFFFFLLSHFSISSLSFLSLPLLLTNPTAWPLAPELPSPHPPPRGSPDGKKHCHATSIQTFLVLFF